MCYPTNQRDEAPFHPELQPAGLRGRDPGLPGGLPGHGVHLEAQGVRRRGRQAEERRLQVTGFVHLKAKKKMLCNACYTFFFNIRHATHLFSL